MEQKPSLAVSQILSQGLARIEETFSEHPEKQVITDAINRLRFAYMREQAMQEEERDSPQEGLEAFAHLYQLILQHIGQAGWQAFFREAVIS